MVEGITWLRKKGEYFMSDLASNITNSLLQLRGKSADYTTHAMKMLGGGENGSMVDGLLRIVSALDNDKKLSVKEAKTNYGLGGVLIGAMATGIIGGSVWLYSEKKKKKKYEEECKIIEKTLDDEIKFAEGNVAVDAEKQVKIM